MDRRQRNFLLVVAAAVALFALVLIVLRASQQQNVPGPIITPQPTAPATGTPAATGTGTSIPQTPTPTPQPGVSPSPSATARPPMAFYVAPDGNQNNDGSKDHPWTLQYALSQPAALQPGDTIWVRGGNYVGSFTCTLKGSEGKPITVRAYPGERAILENNDRVLDVASSAYVNLWGLEITATQNNRDPKHRQETAYGVRINQGKPSHDIKFINMIVHDMPTQGFGWWQADSNSEIYGSLIYYNGVTQLDHGIYVHNNDGKKDITDNIIFDNASHGIHAYGEKDYQGLNNITIAGNTLFDNGSIGYSSSNGLWGTFKRNILVGGDSIAAQNPVIENNYTYYPDNSSGVSLNLGYRAGSKGAVVENNYFAGGQVELSANNSDAKMQQNSILGTGLASLSSMALGQENQLQTDPGESKVFIRPNQYEPGRANITIYNWPKSTTVTITADMLKNVQIQPGDHYELHSVQDYFNDVLTGTYDGQKIEVPMTNHSVAQPLGLNFKPPSTFPEFGAFVLIVQAQN